MDREPAARAAPAATYGARAELGAVFLGGAVGALVRAGLAEAWPVEPGRWPWATLTANLLGCLVLGAVLVRTAAGTPRRGLLGPGLCGALTTFATLQLELVALLDDGHGGLALAYTLVSLSVGLAAVEAGRWAAGGTALRADSDPEPER